MALQVGPVTTLIQEVGRSLGAGPASELAGELARCTTPGDVAKIAEKARRLLSAQHGSSVRASTQSLPPELDRAIDAVLSTSDTGTLDRGALVVGLERVVEKGTALQVRANYKFQMLPPDKKAFVLGMIQDAFFWADLEAQSNPGKDDGFKFLAASYGLTNAIAKADARGLAGKEREDFLNPHQSLFTMFNPHSGNGQEA